jgi:type 1 glutamine amidotransferase
MRTKNILGALALMAVLTASAYAEGIPGKTRPIRVGIFKGTGTGEYWHTNIHTVGSALASILANPVGAGINLGNNPVVPDSGFTFTQFGLTGEATGTPSLAQTNAFIAALDTLDVAIISAMVNIGNVINSTAQRNAMINFWQTKGYIAVHASTDSKGTWPALDSVQAARFQNHPRSDRNGTLRLDTIGGGGPAKPEWAFLNRGLADTTFVEEWFSFTQNANVIRSFPNLQTTVNIDEASYVGGLDGARQMGSDHPMSWYRKIGTTGRFFYTAVGHRAQNIQGGNNPRFLRRQLYNAILWAAGYDTVAATSIKSGRAPGSAANFSTITVSPSALTVTMVPEGDHTVELLALDGRRVAIRQGSGHDKSYSFPGLRPGIYALAVSNAQGRTSRLVTVP